MSGDTDPKVEALAIAFVELAKHLGRHQAAPTPQLIGALKAAARSEPSADTKAALLDIVRHLER